MQYTAKFDPITSAISSNLGIVSILGSLFFPTILALDFTNSGWLELLIGTIYATAP